MSLDKSKLNKDTFCIAPWTEMHFGVKKEVMPCCIYDKGNPIGSLIESDNVEKIYNSEKAKKLRSDLFNGIKSEGCENCWKDEKITERESYRGFHNRLYSTYLDEVLKNTNEDFSLKNIKLRRLDIRFDNKCNLKCRICNSDYSTTWYADDVKLGRKPKQKTDVYKQTISTKVFDFILDQLPNVDELFFAGGEPLIQDNHYKILEAVIDGGYSKQMRLTYNTNFSTLKYKNKNIVNLWKEFKKVDIGASLDANLKQGEYQRKNIEWDLVEKNRKILKKLDNVGFIIIPTVGILNVYNLPNFHKDWYKKKFLGIDDVKLNILSGPKEYDIKNLPEHHKDKIKKLYKTHITWLKKHNSKSTIEDFKKIIKYLETAKPEEPYLEDFIKFNTSLDEIRNESFYDIYPEYRDLVWYVKYKKVEWLEEELKYKIDIHDKKLEEELALFEREIKYRDKELNDSHKKFTKTEEHIKSIRSYIAQLEEERDMAHQKVIDNESFINKTIIESHYISLMKNLIERLDSREFADTEILSLITVIKKRLKMITSKYGYTSLL